MTRPARRHLTPRPAQLRATDPLPAGSAEREAAARQLSLLDRYAHSVSLGATDGETVDGVLSFAVIDAYTDIVLRTGTEREWRNSRLAAARDGEPGIIDDFDGRAVYVEDWRG